jgi:hypothetical protein
MPAEDGKQALRRKMPIGGEAPVDPAAALWECQSTWRDLRPHFIGDGEAVNHGTNPALRWLLRFLSTTHERLWRRA